MKLQIDKIQTPAPETKKVKVSLTVEAEVELETILDYSDVQGYETTTEELAQGIEAFCKVNYMTMKELAFELSIWNTD